MKMIMRMRNDDGDDGDDGDDDNSDKFSNKMYNFSMIWRIFGFTLKFLHLTRNVSADANTY